MKKFRSALAFTLIMMLLCTLVPALAESYYFTINNYTGQSISELYLYPTANNRFGDPRNTKGYIRDHESGKIYFTSQEMKMPGKWSLRIGLKNAKYSTTYYIWDEMNLNDLIGEELNLTFTADGHLNLKSANESGPVSTQDLTVKISNYTGDSITEVYIYPSNNSKWGYSRTKDWIYNYGSATFTMTAAEVSVSTEWTIKLCFKSGRSAYSVTWDEWDISDIIGHELTVYMSGENSYTIDYSPLENGSV